MQLCRKIDSMPWQYLKRQTGKVRGSWGGGGIGGGVSKPKETVEFHGSVTLSPTKLTPQVAKIAEEVVQHLASKISVEVPITIDLHAKLPEGFDADTVRTVTENCIALGFDGCGFEGCRGESG
jgi:hypothetical protein